MTHTEHTHIMFGFGVAAMGLFALWTVLRPDTPVRYVWPMLAFLIGFFLFIPTETQERTYAEVGFFQTFLSSFPDSFATWMDTVRKFHVIQHKVAGLLAMTVGVVEVALARGRLTRPFWGRLLPFLSIGIGLSLGFHGGGDEHLPFAAEQFHHHLLGAAFVAGGVVLALTDARLIKANPGIGRMAWSILALIAGLDMALFYRVA